MARYRNDYYYQISSDIETIPGNPWFICTLWMAEYEVMVARSLEDLAPVREVLEWVAQAGAAQRRLAEQVHPLTGAPLSVSRSPGATPRWSGWWTATWRVGNSCSARWTSGIACGYMDDA